SSSITAFRRNRSTKPSQWQSGSLPCRTTQRRIIPCAAAATPGGNTRARCGPRPEPSIKRNLTRSPFRAWLGCGRPETRYPRFKAAMLAFERSNWALGMKVLSCLAQKLGFAPDFFTDCHDPVCDAYQSTLRLLHYLSMADAKPADFDGWRAGAHTDF